MAPHGGQDRLDADVVIVGFGGAGASAAIAAHDAGARVVVLEKADEGGGSTRESGGTIRRLRDPVGAVEHYKALTRGGTPDDMLEAFVQGVVDLSRWLQGLGAELIEWDVTPGFPPTLSHSAFPNLPGSDALDTRIRVRPLEPTDNGGSSLWRSLARAVEERGILVQYQTRCTRLVTDADGNVVGVRATGPEGSDVVASARRAVVLTCGGFAYNAEMQMDYVGTPLNAFGPPGRNTGDGIKMALAVGADLWHMNAVVGPFGYKVDGYDAAFHHRMPSARYIYLDQNGRRFLNEMGIEHHACTLASLAFDPTWASTTFPRIPSYVIFDERTRLDGPICSGNSGYNRRFPWSEDNSAEIEKGWIKRAGTIEDLASQLGLPVSAVVDEIGRFGRYCADGHDPQFGRQPQYLLPLDSPPYYGVAIWPTLLNTQGGPRRDKHARVLDPFGQPIPRLFSAGELGSMWGMLYPGAGNVSEALIFGRIAGANAAAVPPPARTPIAADQLATGSPERGRS